MDHEAEFTLGQADRRLIGLWAADCAERVLPLFEASAPTDARPREAIAGGRAFASGEMKPGQLRPLVSAAYAAAREVGDPVSSAAARSAGLAAATPFMHAILTLDQTKHALGPAAYAALARELAFGDADTADDEIGWAVEHAPHALREVLRRLPPRVAGGGRLDQMYLRLDVALRLFNHKSANCVGADSSDTIERSPM